MIQYIIILRSANFVKGFFNNFFIIFPQIFILLLRQLTDEDLCAEPLTKAYEENRRNMRILQGFLTTALVSGASRKFNS